MSVLQKTVSAGLIAVSLGVALTATAPAAEAHDHFWAGVAAGTVGGLIGGAIASQPRAVYVEPEYRYVAPPPPPRSIIASTIGKCMKPLAIMNGAAMAGAIATAWKCARADRREDQSIAI